MFAALLYCGTFQQHVLFCTFSVNDDDDDGAANDDDDTDDEHCEVDDEDDDDDDDDDDDGHDDDDAYTHASMPLQRPGPWSLVLGPRFRARSYLHMQHALQ